MDQVLPVEAEGHRALQQELTLQLKMSHTDGFSHCFLSAGVQAIDEARGLGVFMFHRSLEDT